MDLQAVVKLAGISAIDVVMLYVAYLYYDKNPTVSLSLLFIAVVIALAYVISEVYFKYRLVDAEAKETEANAQWKPIIGK